MAELQGPQFTEGSVYRRATDIHDKFGGGRQGGIAPSRKSPAIFIFTGEEGGQYGYEDGWDDAGHTFTYTGEGQVGDMTFAKGNKAIRDHVQDGRALHLFQKVSKAGGRYKYLGEMQCAGTHVVPGKDREGNRRQIIKFDLVRLRALEGPVASDNAEPAKQDGGSLEDLRKKAYESMSAGGKKKSAAVRSLAERSKDVVRYALARAKGKCESCGDEAPFLRSDGTAYLEVHHVDRLSDGGLDAPDRVAAICPTCHRRIHHGHDGSSINAKLRLAVKEIERSICLRV